jgi:acyl-coenzyme A synthetase/AMP-(fatty) acid ligase
MMWNWMVTALSLGTSLVLYDGSPLHPNPGALWDLVIDNIYLSQEHPMTVHIKF